MEARGPYRAFVFALLAAWVVCFGLSLDDVLRQTAYSPILVSPAEDSTTHPTVAGFKIGLGAERSGLSVGDRLLALGGADLRGGGYLEWVVALARFQGRGVEVPVRVARGDEIFSIQLRAASHFSWWPRLVASLVFAACALLLLVRLRQSQVVRALVLSNLVAACLMACFFSGDVLETRASFVAEGVSIALAVPLSLRAFLLFPHGAPSAKAWVRWGPWAFVAIGPFETSLFWGTPFSHRVGAIGCGVLASAYVPLLVAALTRSYRLSDPIGRRQLRWVLLGGYLASVPFAFSQGLAIASPGVGWALAISISGTAILPISILIAITRYNFLDVDRLLTSTASFSVLLVLVLAALALVVPVAAASLSEALGLHPAVARLFLFAGLVVPLVPVHRHLRAWIERFFLAEHSSLERGIAELAHRLSGCETPEALARMTGEGLEAQLRPKACVIYTRSEDVLAPAFVRGDVAPPRFAAASPLVAALEEQKGPLAVEGLRGGGYFGLGAFQRAVLETLDVSVVVPVRLDQSLVAFLCLGEKSSGDVYTASDLALLALVADKVSSELQRFHQSELLRASRALQERLRRYVPGTLAERLDRGEDLDVGEAVVSVLFVDLRGYSHYAEDLEAEQIFSTVNRYTETVSSLIHEHGGTVVEFNGDGMMAVFGAPQPLEQKEEAAVLAGRAIVERVPALAGSTGTLSVGVGVATGRAFVGNVHAVDRLIWTALGNTTNLASRLQSLTRDLGAAMIIDEATWQRSGAEARRFFRYDEAPIRGRERPETIYLIPLPVGA